MSRVKETVKRVLDDFFGVREELEMGGVDEEDTEILSTAIAEALDKEQ